MTTAMPERAQLVARVFLEPVASVVMAVSGGAMAALSVVSDAEELWYALGSVAVLTAAIKWMYDYAKRQGIREERMKQMRRRLGMDDDDADSG